MRSPLRLLLGFVLCAFLLPQTMFASAHVALVINTATVDYTNNLVTITGQNFGTTAPTVQLAGATLTVQSFDASTQTIVAGLPLGLSPGTYCLR